jgi:hypothetical protein
MTNGRPYVGLVVAAAVAVRVAKLVPLLIDDATSEPLEGQFTRWSLA